MKKFKAVLAVVMIAVLTFVFAACSNGGASSDGSGSSKADTASSDNSDSKSNSKGSDDLLPEFDKSGTIKETHMTDVFDVSITATEHLQELFGILLFSVSGNPSLHPVDHYGSADFL